MESPLSNRCPASKRQDIAVKEKASGLLFVHQLTMQPDRQKHMLRVPFQRYINSHPCPSLSVYHFTTFDTQTIKFTGYVHFNNKKIAHKTQYIIWAQDIQYLIF